MKSSVFSVFSIMSLLLIAAGCAPGTTTTPLPPVTLDTTGTTVTNSVQALAEVVPAQESNLSFAISGLVKEVTIQEGAQVQAGQTLVRLDTTEQEYSVFAAEDALHAAEIDAKMQRYRRRKINYDTGKIQYLSGPREQIQKADAKVDQMKAALETAKTTLAQDALLAPFDGTVVAVKVVPGECVQPSQVVVVIADLKSLQIETTDLSELNVAAVKIGQPVNVSVEALNQEFLGKVTAIAPKSNTIGGDEVFKVTVQLDEQPKALLWGMSADVEINVE
jgi:membrane fusion protein (multidrug efflux system)